MARRSSRGNPYHDSMGRFTTKDGNGAVNVCVNGENVKTKDPDEVLNFLQQDNSFYENRNKERFDEEKIAEYKDYNEAKKQAETVRMSGGRASVEKATDGYRVTTQHLKEENDEEEYCNSYKAYFIDNDKSQEKKFKEAEQKLKDKGYTKSDMTDLKIKLAEKLDGEDERESIERASKNMRAEETDIKQDFRVGEQINYVPDWIVHKNLNSGESFAFITASNKTIKKETPKAICIEADTDYGKVTLWCPKSIF